MCIINVRGGKHIVYVSGGKLGDLIHQLSIISEMYLTTERKGVLYLRPDHFNSNYLITYNDTYNLITQQPYIENMLYGMVNRMR
jgi:hypothetical protein